MLGRRGCVGAGAPARHPAPRRRAEPPAESLGTVAQPGRLCRGEAGCECVHGGRRGRSGCSSPSQNLRVLYFSASWVSVYAPRAGLRFRPWTASFPRSLTGGRSPPRPRPHSRPSRAPSAAGSPAPGRHPRSWSAACRARWETRSCQMAALSNSAPPSALRVSNARVRVLP